MVPYLKLMQELIRDIAGKGTEVIADLLIDKKDVNEFRLAKKLKLTINQTRNILYKLHAQNILSFIRKKDKSKGWYVYYYTLNTIKALEKLVDLKKKELLELDRQAASRKGIQYFICPGCGIEINEEHALSNNFMCSECGELLKLSSHEPVLAEIKEKTDRINKEIHFAQNELDMLLVKENKRKDKEILKKKEEKARIRAKARKKTMKGRKKAKPKKKKAKKKRRAKVKKKKKHKTNKKKSKGRKKTKAKKRKK